MGLRGAHSPAVRMRASRHSTAAWRLPVVPPSPRSDTADAAAIPPVRATRTRRRCRPQPVGARRGRRLMRVPATRLHRARAAARAQSRIGKSEKDVIESTTSLIFRASVHPDCPDNRGCLSYSTNSCRKPSHVINASTLTFRSEKRRNASTTTRSRRKKSAPRAGMSLIPTSRRIIQ